MLDDQDIQKLSSILATKKDFSDLKSEVDRGFGLMATKSDVLEVKKDVEGLRESIQGMMVSVDNLAKVISDLRLEYAAISTQLSRHDRWIRQIAEKVGLNLVVE
jgi:cell division protein FtsL